MPEKKVSEKRIEKSRKTQPGGLRKFGAFFVRLGRRLKSFFINMKAELKRVTWPDRKKLIQNTATVLAICALFGILLWIVDTALGAILNGIGFYATRTTTVTTAATTVATTTLTSDTSATAMTSEAGETTAGTTAAGG